MVLVGEMMVDQEEGVGGKIKKSDFLFLKNTKFVYLQSDKIE